MRFSTSPDIPDDFWSPENFLLNGYGGGALLPEAKRSVRETEYYPRLSAEVKELQGSYKLTPPYALYWGQGRVFGAEVAL